MGQSFKPNGQLGGMGSQVKANDMTGVPKELQTWNGMQARMDPDRARMAARKEQRAANSMSYHQAWKDNLQALREKRIELAARASKAGSVEVRAPCKDRLHLCNSNQINIPVHSHTLRWVCNA